LLLDEPTSALDPSVQAGILNLLAAVAAEHGMTMILVSHDMGVIAHLCDRAAVMQNGRIERLLGRQELDLL
jgi:peptide/nickel transport system ATP-binding protein